MGSIMRSIMGFLKYCYGPNYGDGSSTFSGASWVSLDIEKNIVSNDSFPRVFSIKFKNWAVYEHLFRNISFSQP